MKFLRIILVLVIVGPILYWLSTFFFYADFKNACFIKIIPSFGPSNWNTKEVLNILRYGSPENYALFCANIDTIDKNPSCGGFDGGCYEVRNSKTVFIGNDQNNIALTAAVFVHETCHAIQSHEGRPIDQTECYEKGSKFLENIIIK